MWKFLDQRSTRSKGDRKPLDVNGSLWRSMKVAYVQQWVSKDL